MTRVIPGSFNPIYPELHEFIIEINGCTILIHVPISLTKRDWKRFKKALECKATIQINRRDPDIYNIDLTSESLKLIGKTTIFIDFDELDQSYILEAVTKIIKYLS